MDWKKTFRGLMFLFIIDISLRKKASRGIKDHHGYFIAYARL
jgi:hypothetical protein